MYINTTPVMLASIFVLVVFSSYVVADQQPSVAVLQPPTSQNMDSSSEKLFKYNTEKRSWNNLQSSWGKRRTMDDVLATRLLNLNNPGSREIWSDLVDRNNNGHDMLVDELLDSNRYDIGSIDGTYTDDEEYYRPAAEKRAWKNMNGAWGKRVERDWNKFRGSWGKREPGWNNLKGLWGKRDGWNKLQSAWGKREIPIDSNNY